MSTEANINISGARDEKEVHDISTNMELNT